MELKKCSICGKDRILDEFIKNKRLKSGLNSSCKQCRKEYNIKNKTSIQKYDANNYIINKDYFTNYNKKYKEENKEVIKIKRKEYNKDNKQNITKYCIDYCKRRMKIDPQFRIREILRRRMNYLLKKSKVLKSNSSILIYLKCTLNELKQHLEKLFEKEMSWENYGTVWEIDHIKPCSLFDLTKEEQRTECFVYTNLIPRFKTTAIAESFGYKNYVGNRDKSNKILNANN